MADRSECELWLRIKILLQMCLSRRTSLTGSITTSSMFRNCLMLNYDSPHPQENNSCRLQASGLMSKDNGKMLLKPGLVVNTSNILFYRSYFRNHFKNWVSLVFVCFLLTFLSFCLHSKLGWLYQPSSNERSNFSFMVYVTGIFYLSLPFSLLIFIEKFS